MSASYTLLLLLVQFSKKCFTLVSQDKSINVFCSITECRRRWVLLSKDKVVPDDYRKVVRVKIRFIEGISNKITCYFSLSLQCIGNFAFSEQR